MTRLSVRARTTLGATVVVAAAIAAISWLLVNYLETSLSSDVDAAVQRQLSHAATAVLADAPLPASTNGVAINVSRPDGSIVPQEVRPANQLPEVIATAGAPTKVESTTVNTPRGLRIVKASMPTDSVANATSTAARSLLIGGPLLVAIVAGLTWFVTGRALRPIAAIRTEFTEITAHNLHRRVPVANTRDEVSRLASTMNVTLDKLESWSTKQRQFVADASHELRSPLSTVRTPLEVALAYPDRADWPQVVAGAVEDLDRLEAITADLLTLARIDTTATARSDDVDLAELIHEVARNHPHVHTELAEGITLRAHRLQLVRVMTNLLDNAAAHTSGEIQILSYTKENLAIVEVIDDGPGIAPADRKRIFERFTRLDEGRSRDAGGSGLGLSIAREIALAHGGGLSVADSATGARFVLELPR